MSDLNHSSRTNRLRQRVAEREQGRARVVSVTTTAAVASVVAAGAVPVALPGAAHGTRSPRGTNAKLVVTAYRAYCPKHQAAASAPDLRSEERLPQTSAPCACMHAEVAL